MALRKGFLRPDTSVGLANIQLGVALGTVFSLLLYLLFYCFRESIRILAGYFTHTLFVELIPRENFYYNLFCGPIVVVLVLSVRSFCAFCHCSAKKRAPTGPAATNTERPILCGPNILT